MNFTSWSLILLKTLELVKTKTYNPKPNPANTVPKNVLQVGINPCE